MSFWQGRSVLITGASGFIGSHLVKRLNILKAKVVTLSVNKPDGLEGKNTEIFGTVEDFESLNKLIYKYKINTIFHLAAQPIVEIGQTNPIKTFEVNIKGTWNVLEAAREQDVKKVIVASTVHVYGENRKVPYKEDYYPQPSRPYETSKACADLLAQVYADNYDLPVEIPRFVNIYGPGDLNFSRLIPKVIKAILEGESPRVWDEGLVRDFLYIDDAINAYLALAEKDLPNNKRGRVFNIGTGKPISIIDLVQKLIDIANNQSIKFIKKEVPKDRSNEVKRQYPSVAKVKKVLGWVSKISLEEGLKKTFDWYKRNANLFAK